MYVMVHLKWFISILLEGGHFSEFEIFVLLRACGPPPKKWGGPSSDINRVGIYPRRLSRIYMSDAGSYPSKITRNY